MANEEMAAPDLLESAARLIERALRQLDLKETGNCRVCNTRRYANLTHVRANERLSQLPKKLRSESEHLRGKKNGRS